MKRSSQFLFIALNVMISIGVAFAVISLVGGQDQTGRGEQVVITVPIIVSLTPGPSPTAWILTATSNVPIAGLPTGLFGSPGANNVQPQGTQAGQSITPQSISTDPTTGATALPPGCILHTVEAGDAPFVLGDVYGVSGFDIMEVNNLNDETATLLQVGDILIIPLEGCSLTVDDIATEPSVSLQSAEGDSTEEAEPTDGPTPTATVTLAPTAATAQVQIVGVASAGDVTAEGVEILNVGNVIDLSGWTLTDSEGNTFTFPDQRRLFTGGNVIVFSRVGQDTPAAVFWNRTSAVWEQGDVVTLSDEDGEVQSTFRITGAVDLP